MDGEQPFIQVGYNGPSKRRKIGDRWTDKHGIVWEQRVGYQARINEQQDQIRHMLKRYCSVCKRDIDLTVDKLTDKIWPKTGMCFDCLQIEETALKIENKYEAYEKKKILSNKLHMAKEFKQKMIESINYLEKDDAKLSMVMPTGELVTWTGALENAPLLKELNGDLKKADDAIVELEAIIANLDK
jgi:hypothetical protein